MQAAAIWPGSGGLDFDSISLYQYIHIVLLYTGNISTQLYNSNACLVHAAGVCIRQALTACIWILMFSVFLLSVSSNAAAGTAVVCWYCLPVTGKVSWLGSLVTVL